MDAPNYIRAWRKHRKLTQEQLGETIGTNGSVVSLLENGRRPLTDEWLGKLAEALGTSRGSLLDFPPTESPAKVVNIWSRATPAERDQLEKVAEAMLGYKAQ